MPRSLLTDLLPQEESLASNLIAQAKQAATILHNADKKHYGKEDATAPEVLEYLILYYKKTLLESLITDCSNETFLNEAFNTYVGKSSNKASLKASLNEIRDSFKQLEEDGQDQLVLTQGDCEKKMNEKTVDQRLFSNFYQDILISDQDKTDLEILLKRFMATFQEDNLTEIHTSKNNFNELLKIRNKITRSASLSLSVSEAKAATQELLNNHNLGIDANSEPANSKPHSLLTRLLTKLKRLSPEEEIQQQCKTLLKNKETLQSLKEEQIKPLQYKRSEWEEGLRKIILCAIEMHLNSTPPKPDASKSQDTVTPTPRDLLTYYSQQPCYTKDPTTFNMYLSAVCEDCSFLFHLINLTNLKEGKMGIKIGKIDNTITSLSARIDELRQNNKVQKFISNAPTGKPVSSRDNLTSVFSPRTKVLLKKGLKWGSLSLLVLAGIALFIVAPHIATTLTFLYGLHATGGGCELVAAGVGTYTFFRNRNRNHPSKKSAISNGQDSDDDNDNQISLGNTSTANPPLSPISSDSSDIKNNGNFPPIS